MSYTTIDDTAGGYAIKVLLPDNYAGHAVIYHHGVGETAASLTSDLLKAGLVAQITSDGYLLASSTAASENWGNQAGLDAYVALQTYLIAHYAPSKTAIFSQSMGGCTGLLTVASGAIAGLCGWFGVYPVCNLANMFAGNAGTFAGAIRTAYGIASDGSDYALKTGAPNVGLASNGATAVASSTISTSFPASSTILGNRKGAGFGSGSGGWNDGTIGTFDDWLEVDFNASYSISEVDVFGVQDNYTSPIEPFIGQTSTLYGLKDFDLQYWDGAAWVTLPGGAITGNNQVWRQLTFTPVSTSKIRVLVHATQDGSYSRVTSLEGWSVGNNHNALLVPAAAYTGIPMRFYASYSDTVVNRTANTDAFVTHVSAVVPESTVITCTGDHGDPSHFQPSDVSAFLARCFAGVSSGGSGRFATIFAGMVR